MLGAAIATFAISAFITFTVAQRLVPVAALTGVFLLLNFVPPFGLQPSIQVLVVLACSLLLGTALLRAKAPAATKAPKNLWLVAFLVYTAIVTALTSTFQYGIFALAWGVTLLLVVAVARRSVGGVVFVPAVLAVVIALQTLLGALEAFGGMAAVWPRPDGSDRITSRVNHLAPMLIGRVLGSLSAPIPYGALAGIIFLVALYMIVERRRRRYILVIIFAAAALLMSGTRSAVVAVLVVSIIWLVSRSSRSRVLVILAVILGSAVLLATTNIVDDLGFDGFEDSTSFLHRSSVIGSIGALLTEQDFWKVLFGNGETARALLQNGIVESAGGVTVFDNQYVRSIATVGVVGTVLLIGSVIKGLKITDTPGRLVLAFSLIMFMSFDALTWRVIIFMFVLAASSRIGTSAPSLDVAGIDKLAVSSRPPTVVAQRRSVQRGATEE